MGAVTRLVMYQLADGGTVVVEVDDDQAGPIQVGTIPAGPIQAGRRLGEVAKEVATTFEDALSGVTSAAQAVSRELRTLEPDELTIQIGLKMTAELGAIIAKAGGEANFSVTMKWDVASRRDAAAAGSGDAITVRPSETPS